MTRSDRFDGCPDARECIDAKGQFCGGRGWLTLVVTSPVLAEGEPLVVGGKPLLQRTTAIKEPICPRGSPDTASVVKLLGFAARRGNSTEAVFDASAAGNRVDLVADLPSIGSFVVNLHTPPSQAGNPESPPSQAQ